MSEIHRFYCPDVSSSFLPESEVIHALRTLRLKKGDEILLVDGKGVFHYAEITLATSRECAFHVIKSLPQKRQWEGKRHIVIAPTKMMERMEWMVEKVTEIGVDDITFIDCENSERHIVRTDRLEKIAIAAMKQSKQAWKPSIHPMISFRDFLSNNSDGEYFIAHCHFEITRIALKDALYNIPKGTNLTILIGPEGDFTCQEVELAFCSKYTSVHLGTSRFRTETAALVALSTINIIQS